MRKLMFFFIKDIFFGEIIEFWSKKKKRIMCKMIVMISNFNMCFINLIKYCVKYKMFY